MSAANKPSCTPAQQGNQPNAYDKVPIPLTLPYAHFNERQATQANRNADASARVVSIRDQIEKAALGGGRQRIEKEHAKGKLTARERLDRLFDTGSRPIEIEALAGEGMYEQEGGCPGGGVVVQIGHVEGQLVIAVANDATVKAGAWFPSQEKEPRAQEIAMENRIPIIYLVDSAGVFLPMQNEISLIKSISVDFRNNARMSSMGIQIAPSWGPV